MIDSSGQIGYPGCRVCRALVFTTAEWTAFTAGVRAGEFEEMRAAT